MTRLSDYATRYRNIAFTRGDNGVLEMRLHTNEGPLLWGALHDSVHAQLGPAFAKIARDPENRVLLITGTGDAFCKGMNPAEMPSKTEPGKWSRILREGNEMLTNLLAVNIPVIGVVNGPALVHAELAVLSDVVIASETAEFGDLAHFACGAVPGDGVQVVWRELIGINRARYFLLTGERIAARRALELGVVNEVLPADKALNRAREIAAQFAAKPLLTLRYTREVLVKRLREAMQAELIHGLALEGLAMESVPA